MMRRRSFPAGPWLAAGVNVLLMGVALLVILGAWFSPAIAANADARAPVVLDGVQLFQVSSSGQFSAEERAESVNQRLQEAVRSPLDPAVDIIERNNLTTILLNSQHLLTVTERDALPGRAPEEQAEDWAAQIERRLQDARLYRTADYLQQALALTVAIVAIATVLHWGMGWFWRNSIYPALNALFPTPEDEEPSSRRSGLTVMVKLLLAIARSLVWLGALLYLTNLYPVTRQWSYRITTLMIGSLTSPILAVGQTDYSIIDLAVLAVMLFSVVVLSRLVTDVLKSRVLVLAGINRGAQEAIVILVRYSLIFIGSLVFLQVWGFDISSLAILASALGVGIGFGMQDIAKNFGSGLVLVFERPIQVGDFVEVGEFQGTVEHIGARSTIIRTLDQISIIMPNSRFLEEEVINWNHGNPASRLHLPIGVAYGSPLDMVKTVLLEAAQQQSGILTVPSPQVFFKGFGESSLNLELLVWIAEPSRQMFLKSELYFRIDALLRQHQVQIPFPQRDLHLRTGSLPVQLPSHLEAAIAQVLAQSTDPSQANPDTNGHSAHP